VRIVGFVLVKVISKNEYHFANSGLKRRLKIDCLEYCGIGRQSEDDVLLSVPLIFKKTAELAIDNYSTSLMYSIFLKRKDAEDILLNIANRECFEILGVFSERLNNLFGSSIYTENDFMFLGVDIDIDGLFPVKEELFAANMEGELEVYFEKDFKNLNEFGIFKSTIEAKRFVDNYHHIQDTNRLENIDKDDVELVSIYRPEISAVRVP
jgi:hypothetical protein